MVDGMPYLLPSVANRLCAGHTDHKDTNASNGTPGSSPPGARPSSLEQCLARRLNRVTRGVSHHDKEATDAACARPGRRIHQASAHCRRLLDVSRYAVSGECLLALTLVTSASAWLLWGAASADRGQGLPRMAPGARTKMKSFHCVRH